MLNKLKCPIVAREPALQFNGLTFYFSRRVTDDEMRYLHECMQRAAECYHMRIPAAHGGIGVPENGSRGPATPHENKE